MPELPEVETVRRELRSGLEGRRLAEIRVYLERLVKQPSVQDLVHRLRGRLVQRLQRRGKYLLFALDSGEDLVLHLGMTGRLLYFPPEPSARAGEPNHHTRLELLLDDGALVRFDDARTFGRVYLVAPDLPSPRGLLNLGPEPWDPEFDVSCLERALAGRKAPIKNVLLQQQVVAGLGNIYADEALFEAGIHPGRPAGSLANREIRNLHRVLRTILEEALEYGGTTFRDYVNSRGRRGDYQQRLRVYGRRGERCSGCGEELQGFRLAGRSCVFCPQCQPGEGTGKTPGSGQERG